MTKADDQKWIADKSIGIIGALLVVIMGMVAYINSSQNSVLMDVMLEMRSDYKVIKADLALVKVQTAPFAIRLTSVENIVKEQSVTIAKLEKKITEHILIDSSRYKNIGAE